MTEEFDAGDIVQQERLALPDRLSGTEADQMCGDLGGRLMAKAVRQLQSGTATRRAQPSGGHYCPWPSVADFEISTKWTARRAFNFMRGTAEWKQTYFVLLGDGRLELIEALDYGIHESLAAPAVCSGNTALIRFAQGFLKARIN